MLNRFAAFFVAVLLLISAPARGQSPEQWQQEVHYDMDITLHADEHQYTGTQRLAYTNNAPDTLHTVYYHLYFNAFHPNSMMAERNRHVPDPDGRIVPRIFTLDEDERGWHRIHSLTQDGAEVEVKIRDTVMEVDLAEPIPPGETTTFRMHWRAQIPLQTRRSGRDSRGGGVDFSMTQWYPKMAEYDERGWHADPYVMREFYAPYGTFDVQITAPAEYTLGATGILQNPDAIGKGYDLDGSGTWRPSDGSPEADSLTWHFLAADVHDFAWGADPDYIHDKVEANGVTHHILYKPDVAENWESLKDQMPRLEAFFSREYGKYPYPQMTVAQGGDGGMEYPMFTLVAGYDNPEFEEKDGPLSILGTTVHEFAHMWYHTALGNNESDYAWIDEGFTSYATAEGFAHLTGRPASHSPRSIVNLQKMGLFEQLSTPADWFHTNTGYGVASYPGGELLVAMLGYVIGDEQRDQWLKRLVRQRTYEHPDPFDLELFAEQVSGMKLDWYFWQFTHSTRQLDDAISDVRQTPTSDGVRVEMALEREGEAVMPHDIELTLADGSTQMVHVPLLVTHGHKPVPDDWIVTDAWPWVYPEKTVTFTVPSRVTQATLDPEGRTPDVNRLNNTMNFPVKTRFLRAPQNNRFQYELGIRPLASYADRFGVGVGVQTRGMHLGDYRFRGTLTLWPEVLFSNGEDPSLPQASSLPTASPEPGNPLFPGSPPSFSNRSPFVTDNGSWFDGIDFELSATAPVDVLGPRATGTLQTAKHLGFMESRLSVQKPLSSPLSETSQRLTASVNHQLNASDRVFGIGAAPIFFQGPGNVPPEGFPLEGRVVENPFRQTHNLSARVEYEVARGTDRISVSAEMGGSLRDPAFGVPFGSGGSATRVSLEGTKTAPLGPFTARADLQFGLGPDDLLPHKRFVLGGRSTERLWRSDTYRQPSAAFEAPVEDAHLVGFGPAGPVAYLENGMRSPRGSRILAGRLSLHAQPFRTFNPLTPLGLELFSGLGTAWSRGAFLAGFDDDRLIGDAGFGARYDISQISHLDRWIQQSDLLQGLDVVARFPVYASDPEIIDASENEFDFRWLIGVQLR